MLILLSSSCAKEAKLLVVKNAKDKDGFAEESITEEYPVYVTEKSATRSEYYAALQAGIQIKLVLEMRLEDWEQTAHLSGNRKEYATQLEYDGAVYDILRTYRTDKAKIEIICT